MKLFRTYIFLLLIFPIIVSCDKWENNNTLSLTLTSDQTFTIDNPEFEVTVFGYDERVADVPASIIAVKKVKCDQIPCKINIDLPKKAQELIKHTTEKGNDHYYLALEWDSNGDGKSDIGIDHDRGFNVDIYTNKVQKIYSYLKILNL